MAAASVSFSSLCATRPITSTRSSSRVLIAILFNKTSLAGGLSLRGHFYSVREGTLSKSFNTLDHGCPAGQRFWFKRKKLQLHDQICPVIALLEIEHKKFPLGKKFNSCSQ